MRGFVQYCGGVRAVCQVSVTNSADGTERDNTRRDSESLPGTTTKREASLTDEPYTHDSARGINKVKGEKGETQGDRSMNVARLVPHGTARSGSCHTVSVGVADPTVALDLQYSYGNGCDGDAAVSSGCRL